MRNTNRSLRMSRTFIYARVSTLDQTTENQIQEVKNAGFEIAANRIIEESISGSIAAMQRPGFQKLMIKLEGGDVLIVTKMDRLGRDAIDVQQTVRKLADMGVRVHCLALGGVDLCSPAGKMTMAVITAVAEFERDLIIERTQAGLSRAKAKGTKLGRKPALSPQERKVALQRLKNGEARAAVAKTMGVSRATLLRLEAAH
jgi:putative DNA-invertase from lambdoid prophage Rac